jgi:DNA-binding MarR family transcriptional regulator
VNETQDALDEVVDDTRRLLPDVEPVGLPITGRVMRLARVMEARREALFAEHSLSVADFDVLATLLRRGGDDAINVRHLQRSMMLSSGGTTKRLDRLEQANLLRRTSDPDDRRGVLISLTDDGRATARAALRALTIAEGELVAEALDSSRQRTAVIDGLRKLLLLVDDPATEDV